MEGLAMAEVAQRMDVSVQAIESLLARGRRGLKQHLAAVWEEYSTS
ncbi:MAG: sigma factor-like helix-turn-helix DNA-binding protein [Pseudomonadota bacterium]